MTTAISAHAAAPSMHHAAAPSMHLDITAAPSMHLDITADVCPMTWVKTNLALESLEAGEVLRLRLNDGDALRSVPMSAKEDGHRVLTVADNGDTSFTLTIRKDGLRRRFAPNQQDT